jgi:hypothetical protein
MGVGVPGGVGHLRKLIRERLKRRILELRAEAALEGILAKPRAGHALARLRYRTEAFQKIDHKPLAMLAKLTKIPERMDGSAPEPGLSSL